MALFELDVTPSEMVLGLLNLLAYLICPVLFIWAVNTLFGTAIPLMFKTWLAGLILLLVVRFIIKGSLLRVSAFDDPCFDEDEESLFWDESMMGEYGGDHDIPRESRRGGKVIFHPACQDERMDPPDSGR